VHWTLGILRRFRPFSGFEFSCSQALSTTTPLTVTQTVMLTKIPSIQKFHRTLIHRFGSDAFTVAECSNKLGPNHVVFRSRSNQEVELSVVAEEGNTNLFSIQVEIAFGHPDFGILVVDDHLSLDEMLAIFSRYAAPA
jgi:hypothetical protein